MLLPAAHDTTHMGGGHQAFDEAHGLATDEDVGVDARSLASLQAALADLQLEHCQLQKRESICMAALVSTIMFPFDVDALAYACKNYRRSMFELTMYAAPLCIRASHAARRTPPSLAARAHRAESTCRPAPRVCVPCRS